MKKIILAVAVAMVAGSPIASAAGNDTEPGSRTCTYQGEKFDLCHQDTHKNGGAQAKGDGAHRR